MLIRIEQGNGRKDRNAMHSPHLLDLLRQWWHQGKRRGVMLIHGWLFAGRTGTDPVPARHFYRVVQDRRSAQKSTSGQARTPCKLGGTARLARLDGENPSQVSAVVGVRMWF